MKNFIEYRRFAEECAKLNPAFEQRLAEEGLSEDSKEWPEFSKDDVLFKKS